MSGTFIVNHAESLGAAIDSLVDFLNTYSYDNLHRMTRIEHEGQSGGNTVAEKRVDLAFNAAGQFTAIDRYKDLDGGSTNLVVASTFDYDLIGRLTDLVHTADTTEIATYHWDYDAYSRITFFSFAFSAGDDGSSEFDYDATGQLIGADHTAQTDEAFAFDENGNRTMSGYVTGDNNLVLSDGEFNYLYDPEGNRLSKTRISNDPADDKTVEYEWDHRNRLTAVFFKNNQGTLTSVVLYQYDVFDRRTRKIIDRDGVGEQLAEQIDFIYDGQNIILALDGEGSLANRYLHGPGIDQILADEQVGGAGVLWTLTDNQGSVRDVVNNSGSVESHLDYTSFGKVETETQPAVRTLYGWTGRERDTETGLNHHRDRYYDPILARWISEDPIGFKAGDWNLERLTGNDPINFRDPDGREEIGVCLPPWRYSAVYDDDESRMLQHQRAVQQDRADAARYVAARGWDLSGESFEWYYANAWDGVKNQLAAEEARRQRHEDYVASGKQGEVRPSPGSRGYAEYLQREEEKLYGGMSQFDKIFMPGAGRLSKGIAALPVPMNAGRSGLVGGGQQCSASIGNNSTNSLTARAARRQAMREAGIPTSQQPKSQRSVKAYDGTPAGRQYSYEVPKAGGGKAQHSVQHSLTDKGHRPHWEAGPVKPGGQTDSLGRPRLDEGRKVKVNE